MHVPKLFVHLYTVKTCINNIHTDFIGVLMIDTPDFPVLLFICPFVSLSMNTRSLFVHLAIYLIHANQIKPTSSGSHRCYGLHPPFQHLPRQEQRESGDHDNLG